MSSGRRSAKGRARRGTAIFALSLVSCADRTPPAARNESAPLRESAAQAADPADPWFHSLEPVPAEAWCEELAAHLLERAGFGGPPEEVQALASLGLDGAVRALLEGRDYGAGREDLPSFVESPIYPHGHAFGPITEVVRQVVESGTAFGVAGHQEGPLPFQPGFDEFFTLLYCDIAEIRRAALWWAERMVLTPRPFEEKLALFWHGVFACNQEKVHRHRLLLRQIETFRRHGAGPYRELLLAVARDPAMQIMLDNKDNVAGHPNENFARELCELFTLGDAVASEEDVRQIARCFTGWTLRSTPTSPEIPEFVVDPALHCEGTQTVFGVTRDFSGEDVIDLLLARPQAPRFLAGRLYRFFVREDLDPGFEEALGERLAAAGFDTGEFLSVLLRSRDFFCSASRGALVKSPVQLLVSTDRKLGLDGVPGIPDFATTCQRLGQELLQPPSVAGWGGSRRWLDPSSLVARQRFLCDLLHPDPEHFVAPDRMPEPSIRSLPLELEEYGMEPVLWNEQRSRLEPVSREVYLHFLAGRTPDRARELAARGIAAEPYPHTVLPRPREGPVETHNLFVGAYRGWQGSVSRVLPVPRDRARLDLVSRVRSQRPRSAEEVVRAFERWLLQVPLSASRHAEAVSFLQRACGERTIEDLLGRRDTAEAEEALRTLLLQILCAPEYQLGLAPGPRCAREGLLT